MEQMVQLQANMHGFGGGVECATKALEGSTEVAQF
jgi:hypothetical protein